MLINFKDDAMKRVKKTVQAFDPLRISMSNAGLLSPDESSTVLQETSFDRTNSIYIKSTPHSFSLRGIFKQSYAYHWLRFVIPELIEIIIDHLNEDTKNLIEKYGPKVKHELVCLIYEIQNLDCAIKRNCRVVPFPCGEDSELWNHLIHAQLGNRNRLYQVCFMYAQCYIYRRLYSFVQHKDLLHNYDIFLKAKMNLESMTVKHCVELTEHFQNWENNFKNFKKLLEMTMWCNSFDSVMILKDNLDAGLQPILKLAKKLILVNKSAKVWRSLKRYDGKRIDIMVSNVGVDLFCCYLLADYLLEFKYAVKIVFHMKAIPIVTYATPADAERMLGNLLKHPNTKLKNFGIKWSAYFAEQKFEIARTSSYWHSPYAYYRMRDFNQPLYDYLSEAGLAIYLGDFHFRKLVGDFMWDSVEKLITCLRGFQPCDILALRIIRSDCLCGFQPGMSRALKYYDVDWKYSRNFGTILFERTLNCKCHLEHGLKQDRNNINKSP